MRQMLRGRYLQQAEHGVAHVEAVPPVVVGDVAVTLPHCVHPPGQRLGGDKVMRMEYLIILEGFEMSHGHDLHLYKKTPKTELLSQCSETHSPFTATSPSITQICSYSMTCFERLIKDHIYFSLPSKIDLWQIACHPKRFRDEP